MVSRKILDYRLTANVVVLVSRARREGRDRFEQGRRVPLHPAARRGPGVGVRLGDPLRPGAFADTDPEPTVARRLPSDPEAPLGLPGNREPVLLRRFFLCLPP